MVIVIDAGGNPRLELADDFRRFEVDVEDPRMHRREAALALAALGEMADEDHVWIDESRLVKLAGRENDDE